jgi:hypothetical protein
MIFKMRKCIKYVLVLQMLFLISTAFAQSEKLHTVFIYNFTKHIEWPQEYRQGDFIIGVLGSSPIVAELEQLASTRSVAGQKIVIEKFKNADEITKCHIIYIPQSKSDEIDAVISAVKDFSTLIVTDKKGMARAGAAINFIVEGSKQKFELKRSNATKYGLKISSDLERLAIVID